MSATALIAEDEPLLAADLEARLAKAWPALRVVARALDGATALSLALAQRPRIVFLDIRMPVLDGLGCARRLLEDWPPDAGVPWPLIVFVSAHDEHALAAFDVQAFDFVTKPVHDARLARTVERLQARLALDPAAADARPLAQWEALARLERSATDAGRPAPAAADAPATRARDADAAATGGVEPLAFIPAQTGAVVHLVPVADVLCFDADDKVVRVVTAARDHLVRMPLRELLPRLDPDVFWPIHRGTVVRADAVDTVTRDDAGRTWLTLRGRSEKLAVSRVHALRFRPW